MKPGLKKVLYIVKSDFKSMNLSYPLMWNLYAFLEILLTKKISYIYIKKKVTGIFVQFNNSSL